MPRFDLQAPKEGAPNTFATADAARAWLATQSQAAPLRILQALGDQLDALYASPHDGMTRATIVEALRNAALTAQAAARRKYAFQPRPLAGEPGALFAASRRVGTLIAANYLRSVDEFADQTPIDPVKLATAAHRAMLTLRLLGEEYFLAGQEVPPALWRNVQQLLATACSRQIETVDIVDPEVRDPGSSTLAAQHAILVLTAMCDPYRLNAAQFTVLQRALFRWRDLLRLGSEPDNTGKARWLSLASVGGELPDGPAWVDVASVRSKLKGRIKSLDEGETPESLQLGRDLSARACRDFLDSLLEALRPRKPAPRPETSARVLRVATGTDECFALLGGRRPGGGGAQSVAASRVANERMAIFGDPSGVAAEAAAPPSGEAWQLIEESVEAETLYRPADAPGNSRVSTGQLVAVGGAEGHTATLGVVTRVIVDLAGGVQLGVRRFPGQPAALNASSASNAAPMSFVLFLLPEVPALQLPPSVILPSGTAIRLRQAIRAAGHPDPIQLGTLLERGNDFERYALA